MMIIIIMMIFMNIMMIIIMIFFLIEHFHHQKFIFFCIYKMYLISAEGYKNAGIHFLKVRKIDEIWVSMKDSRGGLGVKNIYDLVLKEIYGICGKKI